MTNDKPKVPSSTNFPAPWCQRDDWQLEVAGWLSTVSKLLKVAVLISDTYILLHFLNVWKINQSVFCFFSSSFQNLSEFLRSRAPTVRWVNDFSIMAVDTHQNCLICLKLIDESAQLQLILTGDRISGKERLCGSSGPCGSSGWVEMFGDILLTGCD